MRCEVYYHSLPLQPTISIIVKLYQFYPCLPRKNYSFSHLLISRSKPLKLPFFYSDPLVGLDIETDGLRLIQVKKNRHSLRVEQAAYRPLSADIFVEGKIKNWELLHSELSDLVYSLGLAGRAVALGLPANRVRVKHMTIPAGLSCQEIETSIHLQLRHDLPGLTDVLSVDFTETKQKDGSYSDLFFVATRQEYLSLYINYITLSGLKVKIIDVDVYAIVRAICCVFAPAQVQADAHAIVYKRNAMALFIVFNAEEVVFYQQWDWTESANFSAQIQHKMQMYQATAPAYAVVKLIICGHDEELDTKLLACLTDEINLFSLCKVTPDYLIALGLALREAPTW